jgi:hypothetical protein
MTLMAVSLAALALGVGIWIGLGAPGWPHRELLPGSRRRLEKRPLNPIAWGRSGSTRRSERRRRR